MSFAIIWIRILFYHCKQRIEGKLGVVVMATPFFFFFFLIGRSVCEKNSVSPVLELYRQIYGAKKDMKCQENSINDIKVTVYVYAN